MNVYLAIYSKNDYSIKVIVLYLYYKQPLMDESWFFVIKDIVCHRGRTKYLPRRCLYLKNKMKYSTRYWTILLQSVFRLFSDSWFIKIYPVSKQNILKHSIFSLNILYYTESLQAINLF